MNDPLVQLKNRHLKRVSNCVKRAGLSALLVSDISDIQYLTGFNCEGTMLLIPASGAPVFFVDPMNALWAYRELENISLGRIEKGPVAVRVRDCLKVAKGKIGVDTKALSAWTYDQLTRGKKRTSLVDGTDIVSEMRMIKNELEIDIMRRAAKMTMRIWKTAASGISPGMTEKSIARMIDIMIREQGCDNSFETIAAVAENSAYPHSRPGNRKLGQNEHVMLDFGLKLGCYCSDLTRVYAAGRINRKISGFRRVVIDTHDRTIKRIKPGVSIGSLVSDAREHLIKNSAEEYVLHGLGHGVGLNVHERPLIYGASKERLKKGMVITVEPGLYCSGIGGFREENMVLVTAGGCEVLTV